MIFNLVSKSSSETYGARNLRRTIQKEIEDSIASEIVDKRKGTTCSLFATAEDCVVGISEVCLN